MANVTRYKTSKGETRYRVRYRKPDGTQTDKRGFKRKIDAENWAAEHVTIAKATDMFVDPQAGNRLIGELHDEWLAERKPFWKPSHIGREQCLWRTHCVDVWSGRRINGITHGEVQRWVSELASRRSATVVIGAYGILAAICRNAVRDKLMLHNPCEGIELPRKPQRKQKRVYLTASQVIEFADEARNAKRFGDVRRALVLTLGFCGLRWGEASGLRVEDVDLRQGVLRIRHNTVQVNGKPVDGTPKSSEQRIVPIPRIVIDALGPLLTDKKPLDRVFTDPNGRPIRQQAATDNPTNHSWWPEALRRLGWDPSMWPSPHDMRHTFASLAVHAGANVKALQRVMGHASASMTLDVYADLFDGDLMDVARMIDATIQIETGRGGCGQNVGKIVSETPKAGRETLKSLGSAVSVG